MAFDLSAVLGFKVKGTGELTKAGKQVASFKSAMSGAGQKAKTMAKGATAIAVAGTLVAAGVGLMVNSHLQFEKQMASVVSKMADGKEHYTALEETAKRLGSTTIFTARQAAGGLEFLALAGFKAKEAIGVLPTILKTAAVGNMDLALASDIVTDSMSALSPAFDKNATKTQRAAQLANMMALAQARTNTNIQQLGEAIKFGGGAMSNMKIPLDQIIGSMGALANAGIKGSMGGTALVNMMNKMAKPSAKSINLMKAMGISQKDLMDPNNPKKLKSMADIITVFEGALKKQPDVLKKAGAASEIFGLRGQRAFFALANEGGANLKRLSAELKKSSDGAGFASEAYETMTDNLFGAVESFKSAGSGIALELGKIITQSFGLKEGLQEVTTPMQDLTSAFMAIQKPTKDWSVMQQNVMKTGIGQFALGFMDALKAVRNTIVDVVAVGRKFFGMLDGGGDTIRNITKIVVIVAGAMALLGPPVLGLGAALMFLTPVVSGVMAAISLFGTIVLAAASPIGITIIAVGGLLVTLVDLAGGFENVLAKVYGFGLGFVDGIMPAVDVIEKNLMPLITNFGKLVASTFDSTSSEARSTASSFESAGQKVGSALTTVIDVITRFGPIALFAYGALKLFRFGMAAVSIISGIVGPVISTVGTAMSFLANKTGLATAAKWLYSQAMLGVKQIIGFVGPLIVRMTSLLGLDTAATWISVTAKKAYMFATTGIRKGVISLASRLGLLTVAQKAYAIGQKFVTGLTWLWNTAMSANPIGLVIAGVGLLIGAGVLLYKNWDKVSATFSNVWSWIKKITGSGFDKAKSLLSFFGFGGETPKLGNNLALAGAGAGANQETYNRLAGITPPALAKTGLGASTTSVTPSTSIPGAEASTQGITKEFIGAKTAGAGSPQITVRTTIPAAEPPVTHINVGVKLDSEELNAALSKSQRHEINKLGKQTSVVAAERESQSGYGGN